MKIIDLLNKIAKGDIPKKFIYDDKQWEYDEKIKDYVTFDGSRIDWQYTIMEYTNDEIEIIEENKKIEKITINENGTLGFPNGCWTARNMDKAFAIKINEIIDGMTDIYSILNEHIDEINNLKEGK